MKFDNRMYAFTSEPGLIRPLTARPLVPNFDIPQLFSLPEKAAVYAFLAYQKSPDFSSAQIDAKSPAGCTVLHFSCLRNHVLLAVCLLEAGSDPNMTSTGDGSSAAHFAARSGNPVLLRIIQAYGGRLDQPNDQVNIELLFLLFLELIWFNFVISCMTSRVLLVKYFIHFCVAWKKRVQQTVADAREVSSKIIFMFFCFKKQADEPW